MLMKAYHGVELLSGTRSPARRSSDLETHAKPVRKHRPQRDYCPRARCAFGAPNAQRASYVRSETSSDLPLKRRARSEEHTSELQSPCNLVFRLLLEK